MQRGCESGRGGDGLAAASSEIGVRDEETSRILSDFGLACAGPGRRCSVDPFSTCLCRERNRGLGEPKHHFAIQ